MALAKATETIYGPAVITAQSPNAKTEPMYSINVGNASLNGLTRDMLATVTYQDLPDGDQAVYFSNVKSPFTFSKSFASEFNNNLITAADKVDQDLQDVLARDNIINATGTEQTYTTDSSTNSESTTNTSASDQVTAQKYTAASAANPNNLDKIIVTAPKFTPSKPSADPQKPKAAVATFNNRVDQRVRLVVPQYYLDKINAIAPIAGKILSNNNGIVFPYTPTITVEHTANYTAFNAIHSNYTQYFYKNTSVGEISISGHFTVQNDNEAGVLLAINHLLRGLVKMRFGDDQNAGSPPPICKLYAYGAYMFDKTPVVIRSFNLELPDNIDYITSSDSQGFGNSSVPVMSTLRLVLLPIYSRRELLNGTVNGWFSDQRTQGYL